MSCETKPKYQEDLSLTILNENIKVNPAIYSPYSKRIENKNVVIKYKIENKSNHTYLLLNDFYLNGGISWLSEISSNDLKITNQNNIKPKFENVIFEPFSFCYKYDEIIEERYRRLNYMSVDGYNLIRNEKQFNNLLKIAPSEVIYIEKPVNLNHYYFETDKKYDLKLNFNYNKFEKISF